MPTATAKCPAWPSGVEKAHGEKCEALLDLQHGTGHGPGHPTLCPRCAAVLKNLPLGEAGRNARPNETALSVLGGLAALAFVLDQLSKWWS